MCGGPAAANIMCSPAIGPWEFYELVGYAVSAGILLLVTVSLFPGLVHSDEPLFVWRAEK